MRTPNRNPYTSYAPKLTSENPADSPMGRTVRRGDARLRLQEMQRAEEAIAIDESRIAAIDDAERQRLQHALSMQYLVDFGCRAEERHTLREVLEGVAEHGNLTLYEAAEFARMMHRQRTAAGDILGQRNGSAGSAASTAPEAVVAFGDGI